MADGGPQQQQESKTWCTSAFQASSCIIFSSMSLAKTSHMANSDARSGDTEPLLDERTYDIILQGRYRATSWREDIWYHITRKGNNVWPFLQFIALFSFHSSTPPSIIYSSLAKLTLLFLRNSRHALTSGPLHILIPLPEILFYQISTWLVLLAPSGLSGDHSCVCDNLVD